MTKQEQDATIELAFGRILRLAARPTQPGDIEEYERCRKIILDVLDPINPLEHIAKKPLVQTTADPSFQWHKNTFGDN